MNMKKIRQIFEIDANDCSNPVFFTDYETGELVYLNGAMAKKFQIFDDYSGKLARDMIPYYDDICGFRDKKALKDEEYSSDVFLSEMLNANLRSETGIRFVGGRKFIQTKYFLAPSTEKQKEAENLFERAIARCLEILGDLSAPSPIVPLLELLGHFYSCQLAYICEFDFEERSLASSYVWSCDNRDIPITGGLPMERFVVWLNTGDNKSIINLDKNVYQYPSHSIESQILTQYNLENITLSKLWDKDGVLKGVVGLSNRSELMYDDRLLQAVSHFVMEQFSQSSMEEALEDLNDIDILTGFYNRDKYTQKLLELEENPPKSLGVLFVNVNGLRATNEYIGYDEGDMLIKRTASTLTEYFCCQFYRVNGDEFVGFVADCEEEIFLDTVTSLQERLKMQNIDAAFSLGQCWESGNFAVPDMIKIADTVMVINKQSYYADSIKNSQKITNTMLQDMFLAITEEEFLVYLQPQIDLESQQVVAAEALIRRFDKRQNKMIFPDMFIPLYEKKSVIRHVDLFMIRKVCQMIQSWKLVNQELPISVNLSRVTLMEHGIVKTITEILDEYDIPHQQIVIEITERIGLIENDVASSLIQEFKENGFKLSLDDFGCAYSNIVTLAQIEFDEVKIDKSLIDHLISNPKNRIIVKNMLLMCNELENTHTLAEGIETEEQAEFLRSAKCKLGQGYLYSRPIPNEEFYEKYVNL
ncbi:MAG: bifunctional diguanylate cyclase/phosphodiesterase [Eubacteriales bacterium]